jgi:hypothetical protein
MSWRQDSTAGAYIWDTQPMSDSDLLCRDEEIRWLMAHERQRWGLINGRLKKKADPTAYGTYCGLSALPPAAVLGNVASLNGEAAAWTTALFTPWLANTLASPSAWILWASFQATTSTTPANLTINPRVGSVTAGSSSTGGVALGADAAITLTASITTNWSVEGHITIQNIGAPGANSHAEGEFTCVAKPATTGTGAATVNDLFGYTQATFDASVASGFILGLANTVTTITYAMRQIHWISAF